MQAWRLGRDPACGARVLVGPRGGRITLLVKLGSYHPVFQHVPAIHPLRHGHAIYPFFNVFLYGSITVAPWHAEVAAAGEGDGVSTGGTGRPSRRGGLPGDDVKWVARRKKQ